MLDWIGDQILHILNYVPELFLAKDTLRWWFAFVFVVVLALIYGTESVPKLWTYDLTRAELLRLSHRHDQYSAM